MYNGITGTKMSDPGPQGNFGYVFWLNLRTRKNKPSCICTSAEFIQLYLL